MLCTYSCSSVPCTISFLCAATCRFVNAVQLKMMIVNVSFKISMGFPPCRHRRLLQVQYCKHMGVGSQRHVPAALSPRKSACTNCRGGWLGPRVGLYGMRMRKRLLRLGFETRTVPPVAIRWNTLPRPHMVRYLYEISGANLFSEHIARTCIYALWLMSEDTRQWHV